MITREHELVKAVRSALDAIQAYPERKHPLTASEIMLRLALKRYSAEEFT